MTPRPLTPDEARRVTTCDGCERPWSAHTGGFFGTAGGARILPCTRTDETLAQVAALRDEWQAVAWDEGFKQGGPMHDEHYDDPDAHTRNPYREVT